MKKLVQTAIACMAASILSIGPLGAQDLKITYKTRAKAMLMTEKGTEVEYHSKRFKRTNDEKEKQDTLIDYQDFVKYEIDHKKKVIGKTTLEDMLKIKEFLAADLKEAMDAADEKKREKAKRFLGEEANASVKRLGTEMVAGRNCEKWSITVGKLNCNASADPSLVPPMPPDALEKMSKMEYGGFSLMGNFGRFFEAIFKIKGVQLKSEVVMPIGLITINIFREATEVVQGPIPASVFELPKGYKEEDTGKKGMERLEQEKKERLAKKKK